jgi:hypothetical protein
MWSFSSVDYGRLIPTAFLDIIDNLFYDPCDVEDFPYPKFDRVIMYLDEAILTRFGLGFTDNDNFDEYRVKPIDAFWKSGLFIQTYGPASDNLMKHIDLHYEEFIQFFKIFII